MPEAALHLLGRLEIAVGEALAAEAQFVDRAMFADRGDDVVQHALVGAVVEHVAGGKAPEAVAAGERVERVQALRLAGPAAVGEGEMAARPENIGHLGKRDVGHPVRLVGHERGDQAVAPGGDVLPMEEALPLLALLAVDAAFAGGEQAGEPRPGGAILRPDQKRASVHQIEPAAGDEADAALPLRPQRLDEAADRVAVGDAERGIAEELGRREQFVGAGDAAQEAEMGRDLELDIAHANSPCRCQLRSPVAGSSPSPLRNSQKRAPSLSSTWK